MIESSNLQMIEKSSNHRTNNLCTVFDQSLLSESLVIGLFGDWLLHAGGEL